jgi:RNA polymerase sigma-70 factor (ECF subfamily)
MNANKTLTDAELTERFNAGDQSAFEEIYNRYWALLYRHGRRMLQDEEQARDVVQDVFTGLLNRKGRFEMKATLSAYLYSSVRNTIINQIRHERVKTDYLGYLQHYSMEGSCSTDDMVREKEFARQIEKEIERLPPRMREVFELSQKAYLNHKEIANEINVSEGTVKKQIYYALKILRGKLGAVFFLQVMSFILWLNRVN